MNGYWQWISLIFLLCGCGPNQIKIEGEIVDLQGEMRLLTVQPSSLDTLVIVGQMQDSKVIWRLPYLNMPVKVWVEADGRKRIDFILDKKSGMRVDGSLKNDSLVVSGGKLESEYAALKQFLNEKYRQPIEKIDCSIARMLERRNRTRNDEKSLERWTTLKKHYEYYRNEYVKKLIRANLSHELSLLLIEGELQDSEEVRKQLFLGLNIENKNSNLYKMLEKRLQ